MPLATLTRPTDAPDRASSATADKADATPIRRLWAEAVRLEGALAAHRPAIAAAETLRLGATPGWMYLDPAGRAAGEARYQTLIAILSETPRDAGDLAVMARAAEDSDIRRGPRAWAAARVAAAAAALP